MSKYYGKLLAILKYLKLELRNPTIDEHFSDRLIIQKIASISKYLEIDLNYDFGLYKKGPYCPQLTEDYYKNHLEEDPSILNLSKAAILTVSEIGILNKIRDVIFSEPLYETHKIDLLQAISTMLYFIENNSRISEDDLIFKTKMEKPYLTDRIIRIALNLVKKLK